MISKMLFLTKKKWTLFVEVDNSELGQKNVQVDHAKNYQEQLLESKEAIKHCTY